MAADRADFRRLSAFIDVSAVCADPEDFFLFFKDRIVLDILQELAIARFVLFFDFSDHAEKASDVRKSLGFGIFREILIHFGPFVIFSIRGGFQIAGGVGNFPAVQQLKPDFGVLFFIARGFLENSADLNIPVFFGLRREVGVFVACL